MTTQAELRNVMRFSFGSANHRVLSYTVRSELIREGVGHNVFRRHTYSIKTELQGTDLANLKTQLDLLKTHLLTPGSDFSLYRESQVVYTHAASSCHFGPVGRITANGVYQTGTFETVDVEIIAEVPVSISGGLIDHNYTERSTVDNNGDTIATVRTGKVTTESGSSAKTWLTSNLPAQPAGFDRRIELTTDDTDTSLTYTLTDSETTRRNTSGTVEDHKYTYAEMFDRDNLIQMTWRGNVVMVDGESARTFIEANLPATTSGFVRTHRIDTADDDLTGTYEVTDTLKEGTSWPPGIDRTELKESVAIDAQHRRVTTKSGFFIGSNAATEVADVKATITHLISEEITTDIYDDGRITFRFVGVDSDDASDIVQYAETITRSGSGRSVRVSSYPDRAPFIWNGAQQAMTVVISGRAVSVKKDMGGPQYVQPPTPPVIGGPLDFADYQVGADDVGFVQLSDHEFETTWRQTFILPPGTLIPKPRDKTGATFA